MLGVSTAIAPKCIYYAMSCHRAPAGRCMWVVAKSQNRTAPAVNETTLVLHRVEKPPYITRKANTTRFVDDLHQPHLSVRCRILTHPWV